jgi:hypothetical protein
MYDHTEKQPRYTITESKASETRFTPPLLAHGGGSSLAGICFLGLGFVDTLGKDGGVLVLSLG